MLPLLLKQPLSIEAWGKLLKASPLPGSLVAEFVETAAQDQQRQADMQSQQAQALQQSQGQGPLQARLQAEMQKLEVEAALKQQELQLRRYEADLNAAISLRQLEERQAARLHESAQSTGSPTSGGFSKGI